MELTKHWAAQLDDYVIDLAWSPEGDSLAAASAAGPIRLFAGATGDERYELSGHESGTNCIAFTLRSPVLASGGQDGAVKFWDFGSGRHQATVSLGGTGVEKIEWRPEARFLEGSPASAESGSGPELAAACGRKLALIAPGGSIRHSFPDASKTISAISWRPLAGAIPPPAFSSLLAVACFGAVRLWDAEGLALTKELGCATAVEALVWSPNGKWLVSGNRDPSVHLWAPAEETELQMSGFEGKVKHLGFDHTGRWLATSGGPEASIWDCAGAGPEGRAPAMLPHQSAVGALRFQNSHGLLATASSDGAVNLWSPERKQPLRATVRMPGAPTQLAWSPDDRFLAIGSETGAIYVLKCEA